MFHQWVGNWGVAIILLTIVIKLLFYPFLVAGKGPELFAVVALQRTEGLQLA